VAGPFETRFNLLDWLTRAPNVASLALLSTPAALLGLLAFLYRLPVAVAIAAAVFPVIFRFLNSRFAASGASWAALAAEARGTARWRVAAWHILYPERGELAMLAAVSFKWALSAAIPAEVFAGQAGLGELVWKAAEARDLALVLPLTLMMAALVQAAQFLAGLAHRAGRAEAAAV
jgi:ABC-type dipeptide/oligopeptide/nickel transport system permease component